MNKSFIIIFLFEYYINVNWTSLFFLFKLNEFVWLRNNNDDGQSVNKCYSFFILKYDKRDNSKFHLIKYSSYEICLILIENWKKKTKFRE